MQVISRISFGEIQKFLNDAHPINGKNHTRGNVWAHRIIEKADRELDQWHLCELEEKDILEIVLPFHPSEDGVTELVGEDGLPVHAVLEKISLLSDYASNNPLCWKKVAYWMNQPFSPVFLSTTPTGSARHAALQSSSGKLFHLDGFHRLIGWGLADKYNSREYLTAYIAGDLGSQRN